MEQVFVVHGGLATDDDVTLEDIQKVHRFREPPDAGLMSDLLWSDPQVNCALLVGDGICAYGSPSHAHPPKP